MERCRALILFFGYPIHQQDQSVANASARDMYYTITAQYVFSHALETGRILAKGGHRLTSKATSAWLQRLQLAGFVEYECGQAGVTGKRRLFVPSEIYAVLSGATSQPPGFPCATADVMITRYRAGYIVHATRRPQGRGDFKWLENHDEAWVMCFKGAGVVWRMLGRFARPNLFVGLYCVERGELHPWIAYQAKAIATIAEWEKRFPSCEPFRGTKFEDYFGDMVFNEDD